jgi:paraquat-inducible protein B
MTEKHHTVALGAFMTGALLIAISTVIFVIGSGFGRDRETVVMVFEGSVKGLNVGAPVTLRGVQVGQVTDIELVLQSETTELIMLVEAEIMHDRIRHTGDSGGNLIEELVSRGLRAQLDTQSLLTGLLYVQLDFHPDTRMKLAAIDSPHVQIPTIPTGLERITRQFESIDFARMASNLEATASGLQSLVTSESLQAMPASLDRALLSMTELSDELRRNVAALMPALAKTLEGVASTAETTSAELPKLSAQVARSMARVDDAVIAFEQAMREVKRLASPDSVTTYQLNRALQELSQAGRSLQQLAQTLEERPEALIRGRRGEP